MRLIRCGPGCAGDGEAGALPDFHAPLAFLVQSYSVRMARGLDRQKASGVIPQSSARKYSQAQG